MALNVDLETEFIDKSVEKLQPQQRIIVRFWSRPVAILYKDQAHGTITVNIIHSAVNTDKCLCIVLQKRRVFIIHEAQVAAGATVKDVQFVNLQENLV